MKRLMLLLVCVALMPGCSSTTGRGSRLLPWNWFSPDRSTQLAETQHDNTAIKGQVVKKAQENVRAVGKGIRLLPDGLVKQVLQEFNDRADAELADAVGAVAPDVDRGLTLLVQQLTSENVELRTAGQAALAKRDKLEDGLSDELAAGRQREAHLTTQLQESDLKYQAEAESSRRTKFIIYGLIALWVLGNVVGKLAQTNPVFAGAAKAFNVVAMPVLATAKARAEIGLQKVGHAFTELRRELPADTAARVTQIFDGQLDSDHKAAVANAATTAPHP